MPASVQASRNARRGGIVTKTNHTPTPWALQERGAGGWSPATDADIYTCSSWVGTDAGDRANAALIVRAVNAHEALVVAAQQALELLIGASALTPRDVRTALRAALALAEQEVSE